MSKKKSQVLTNYFNSRLSIQAYIAKERSKIKHIEITYKENIESCFNSKRDCINYIRHRFSNYEEVLSTLPNNSKINKIFYITVCKQFYKLLGKMYPALKDEADKMKHEKLIRYPQVKKYNKNYFKSKENL